MERRALLLIAFVFIALIVGLGLPLVDPDEGRNANVAREMLRRADWIVPTLHGLPYLDKPALLFGMIGASFSLFGVNAFAARIPVLLAAAAVILLTFRFARILAGKSAAWRSVMVLASAPLFLGFARWVIFDLPLTALVLASWHCMECGRRGTRFGYAGAWAFAGFAVLMKGPIGLILAIAGWLALHLAQPRTRTASRSRGWPQSFRLEHLAVFAAVATPWIWAVEHAQPGFLRYALLTESFERLTQPTLKRTGPPWYYLPVILLGFLPWGGLLLTRARELVRASARTGPTRALCIASLSIFVFFSLSASKLPGYVLPIFPLLAILIAISAVPDRRDSRALALQLLGLGAAMIVALRLSVAHRLKLVPGLEPDLERLMLATGLVLLAAGAICLLLAERGHVDAAWFTASLALPAVVLFNLPALRAYSEEYGSERLAVAIRAAGVPADRVVLDHCYPTGLEFYLDRTVPVSTDDGRELTSNYIRRHFAQVASDPRLLSSGAVDAGLAEGRFDLVVSRKSAPPDSLWIEAARAGKYRLWRRSLAVR